MRSSAHPQRMLSASLRAAYLRKVLQRWYLAHARDFPWRSRKTPVYQVTIAELLLQRTKAETVAPVFRDFVRRFHTWRILARARPRQLKRYLRPLGLWRRRSASLLTLARAVSKRGGQLPKTRESIESLPGIGQYIANAILCQFHGKREPFLDVNMARVVERYFEPRKLADLRTDPVLQSYSRLILPRFRVKEFNWAVLDFAAAVCRSRDPRCGECPVSRHCNYFKGGLREKRS